MLPACTSLFFLIRKTLRRSLPGHAGSGEDPAAEDGTLRMHSAENWTGVPVAPPAPQTPPALFGHWLPEGLPPAQARRLSMRGRTTEESGSPPTLSSGTSSWHEVSPVAGGFQDPACGGGTSCPYPVSAIALDPNDATGQTAYVVVLGFGIGHIWQTTSAGTVWTDITGNLPDVPSNAVVVDPSSGLVYVGTDIGVFAGQPNGTSTSWTEVGPSSGTGALPMLR